MPDQNPYTSPIAAGEELAANQPLQEIARTTFVAWEKLRLIYIGVLALVTIAAAAMSGKPIDIDLAWATVVGAIFANACYFAGPITETYVTWLGYRGSWLRLALFVTGTLFACGLALGTIVFLTLPPPAR